MQVEETDIKIDSYLVDLLYRCKIAKDMTDLMNRASSLMGNALILSDVTGRVLASSSNFDIVDPNWSDAVKNGRCSKPFMEKIRRDKIFNRRIDDDTITNQFITLEGDKQRKLVTGVQMNGHVLCALVMIEHHSNILNWHVRQSSVLADMLFKSYTRIEKVNFGFRQNTSEGNFLLSILDKPEDQEVLFTESTVLSSFPDKMYVVMTRLINNTDNRFVKLTIAQELEEIFPDGFSLINKGYISILVDNVNDNQRKLIEQLALREEMTAGISWPFFDIRYFKSHYQQAVSCVKTAEKQGRKNPLLDYDECMVYHLLSELDNMEPLSNFRHPMIQLIRNYDEENNAQALETLYAFLENECNITQTAKALFIHRNTLMYRLNRIRETTGLDLSNRDVLHTLRCSMLIDKYITQKIFRDGTDGVYTYPNDMNNK